MTELMNFRNSKLIQNSKFKIQNSGGFTLIELLLVVAISAVAVTTGFLYLGGYRTEQNLKNSASELLAAVKNTQQLSKSQQDGKKWGLRFTNPTSSVATGPTYSVFSGTSYAAGTVSRTYPVRRNISFSNPWASSTIDVIFNAITGYAPNNQVVSLVSDRGDGLVNDLIMNTLGQIISKLDTGIVGYWHFDEGTGTVAYDASGRGNSGTLTNGPTWQTGSNCKAGKCLSFDGVNDYLSLGTSLLNTPTAGSVSMWVYPTQNGAVNGGNSWNNTTFLSKDNIYIGLQQLELNKIRYYYYSGSPNFYDSNTALTLNTWSLITVTWDSNSSIININGVSDASSGSLTWAKVDSANTNTAFELGRYGGGYPYKGYIDEVRIYNRALSATEISDIYNSTR